MHQETETKLLQKHCYSFLIPEGKLIDIVHMFSSESVCINLCCICAVFYVLCVYMCGGWLYVKLTQTRVILKEAISIEKKASTRLACQKAHNIGF